MTAVDQQTVIEWFDSVYRRKGARYLRPARAYLVFLELLRAQPRHRILDVACGPGMLLEAASRYSTRLHGIDVSTVAVEQAKRRVACASLAIANAERLPFRDESFDLITCLGSLERVLDPDKAVEEMRRVGKPDARYCILVRNADTFSWKYFAALLRKPRREGHAGARAFASWRSLFEAHGLRAVDVWPDQYPLHLKARWSSLGLKRVDFARPLAGNGPLERANEFVFLLERAP